MYTGTEITHHMDWVSINEYAPEFVDTSLDIPEQMVDQQFFDCLHNYNQNNAFIKDIILANKVIQSGVPN